eukprot:6195621-Pleurochrysis_carterae.AAC.1
MWHRLQLKSQRHWCATQQSRQLAHQRRTVGHAQRAATVPKDAAPRRVPVPHLIRRRSLGSKLRPRERLGAWMPHTHHFNPAVVSVRRWARSRGRAQMRAGRDKETGLGGMSLHREPRNPDVTWPQRSPHRHFEARQVGGVRRPPPEPAKRTQVKRKL